MKHTDIAIVFENDSIIVADKPQGVLSQASEGKGESILSLLKDKAVKGGELYAVHRLDRETSGLMVIAKTSEAAAELSKQITQSRLIKHYLAVVEGTPTESKGEYRDLLYYDRTANKSFVVKRQRNGVREAALEYSVLASKTVDNRTFSLVKVKLLTGRTHQVRVQFASRGMPLWGDGKYGSSVKGSLGLFSSEISFAMPVTHKGYTAQLPMPTGEPWDMFAEEK